MESRYGPLQLADRSEQREFGENGDPPRHARVETYSRITWLECVFRLGSRRAVKQSRCSDESATARLKSPPRSTET